MAANGNIIDVNLSIDFNHREDMPEVCFSGKV